jgi:hypothetical protein
MNREEKLQEIQRLLARAAKLERELVKEERQRQNTQKPVWAPEGYYADFYLMAGFMFGGIGAAASLLFNIVGSTVANLHPLQIIRVYLTFPMGEAALSVNSGIALGIGCLLYLGTGAMYGMLIHYIMTRYYMDAPQKKRFALVTGISVALWIVNFYLILSWLQPALFGGSWIVQNIPWHVGLSTHLVFGWAMFLVAYGMNFERREFVAASG